MKIPMPAAVLAGGASRRMGLPKAALPYGGTTLLAHQTQRLSELFGQVLVVAKSEPAFEFGPARILLDRTPDQAPVHGLIRALEEIEDRLFVLAVDLPVIATGVIREIARRGHSTHAQALLPRSGESLQPLAAVWRRAVLPCARTRVALGLLSLLGLAEEAGAEVLPEEDWRRIDPSGNSFVNMNTIEDYGTWKERA